MPPCAQLWTSCEQLQLQSCQAKPMRPMHGVGGTHISSRNRSASFRSMLSRTGVRLGPPPPLAAEAAPLLDACGSAAAPFSAAACT